MGLHICPPREKAIISRFFTPNSFSTAKTFACHPVRNSDFPSHTDGIYLASLWQPWKHEILLAKTAACIYLRMVAPFQSLPPASRCEQGDMLRGDARTHLSESVVNFLKCDIRGELLQRHGELIILNRQSALDCVNMFVVSFTASVELHILQLEQENLHQHPQESWEARLHILQ